MEGEKKLFYPFCLGNERVCGAYMCVPPAAFPGHQGAEPWKMTSLDSMSSKDNFVNSHAQCTL